MDSFSTLNTIDINEDDCLFLLHLLEDNSITMTRDYDVGYVVAEEQDQPSSSSPIMNRDQNQDQDQDQERYTYQGILKTLEASMKRSQETRKSLTMKTPKTEEYNRSGIVTDALSSIENSSRQLLQRAFLQTTVEVCVI